MGVASRGQRDPPAAMKAQQRHGRPHLLTPAPMIHPAQPITDLTGDLFAAAVQVFGDGFPDNSQRPRMKAFTADARRQ